MFIKQGKTNIKYLLIVIILAVIVGRGFFWLIKQQEIPIIQSFEIEKSEEKSEGIAGEVDEILLENEVTGWNIYRNEEYGFEFKYPKNFFWWEPEIRITDCNNINLQNECPDIEIESSPFPPREDKIIINGISFCLKETSEGAAGTSYVSYYYTTTKDKKCLTLYLVLANSNCSNLIGSSIQDEESYQQCEYRNKIVKPNILNQILSTFRFLEDPEIITHQFYQCYITEKLEKHLSLESAINTCNVLGDEYKQILFEEEIRLADPIIWAQDYSDENDVQIGELEIKNNKASLIVTLLPKEFWLDHKVEVNLELIDNEWKITNVLDQQQSNRF